MYNKTFHDKFQKQYNNLISINEKLWDIEDQIREHDYNNDFGETFIELAKCVYRVNDERFNVKKQINEMDDSTIQEVKSYKHY